MSPFFFQINLNNIYFYYHFYNYNYYYIVSNFWGWMIALLSSPVVDTIFVCAKNSIKLSRPHSAKAKTSWLIGTPHRNVNQTSSYS